MTHCTKVNFFFFSFSSSSSSSSQEALGSDTEATSATSPLLSCRGRPGCNRPEATHSLRKARTMTRVVHDSSNCNSVSWLPYKKYIKSDISSPPPPPPSPPALLAFSCEPDTPRVSAPVLCKLGGRTEDGRVFISILPPALAVIPEMLLQPRADLVK